jgi:iron donor protein CyaY
MENNNVNFSALADNTIFEIIDAIERHDPAGVIQIEMEGEIISFIVPGNKKYVLNKHNNYQEIWLASPLSGPYHFGYLQNQWIDKNKILLSDVLSNELSQFVNKIKFYL